MLDKIPSFSDTLTENQIKFLETFSKAARRSIIEMVTNAQSGHPGGSLSSIDYLSVLYAFVISQTGENTVISHGHISPAVYSTLANLGYIDREDVVKNFRKIGSKFEGHITRHVPGVVYGTGPLGTGVSAAAGFAMAEKLKENKNVYALMGDGECQEGQVHEMIHFAKHHKLNNFVLFVDYNKVQLTASIKETLDIDIKKTFEAGHWHVIDIDGHDYQEIWNALSEAQNITDRPTVILGHTIMGQGIDFMQETGEKHQASWHGKAPKPEMIETHVEDLALTIAEEGLMQDFRDKYVKWQPKTPEFEEILSEVKINTGTPIRYPADKLTDCRSAYGNALLDLAKNNPQIVALTADLKGSVKTDGVSKELPEQYIECGIAEQHMISAAGGMSLDGFIPFASTFGAFISSRAKDQARVNDINHCNVKMVATHCGLSVGEDGPTHQAIDDKNSFAGFFNTRVLEPACPNQCDAIIRYVANHFGNFYVRMGRHKFPIVTKEDGSIFYDENYKFEYGKSDLIRKGSDITIVASGPCVHEAIEAAKILEEGSRAGAPNISVEIIAVSTYNKFDRQVLDSIEKTGKLITVEDHNPESGMGGQLARYLFEKGLAVAEFTSLGSREYQLSGKSSELYAAVGIDAKSIAEKVKKMV
jgi:transketolase